MNFFIEGGVGMFPVLIVGLIVLYASIRYMLDGEPVRLRFITVLSLAEVVMVAQTTILDLAAVFHALENGERIPTELLPRFLAAGLKESTRPALLGLGLLAMALTLISVGVYRVSRRELRAARGAP